MDTIRIEWDLFSNCPVPPAIRAAVEARLLRLWRTLDCTHLDKALDPGGFRSEGFRIDEDGWTFTYEIDLRAGAAIVRDVLEDASRPALD